MKKTHLILLIVIAASIGIIISMVGGSSSYVTFNTAQSHPEQEFYVVGQLIEDKPIDYQPEESPNHFSFYMKDKKGNSSKVVYHGAKPRDFERSEKIVLVGEMREEAFHARKILLKCPSKYKKDKVAANRAKAESE